MKNIFYKYECAGNSFILVKYQDKINYSEFAEKICSKVDGIGSDGLIVVKEGINEIGFFNQDGSPANFCGNGSRAYLNYLDEHQGINNRLISFIFNNEIYYGKVISKNPFLSKIIINKNRHIDYKIPSKFNNYTKKITYPSILEFKDFNLKLYPIKVGVFHLVIINETKKNNSEFLSEANIIKLKQQLQEYYLEEPNIDIVKVKNKEIEEITFYERGVGYTRSCGSGSIAVCLILELLGLLRHEYIKINDDLMVVLKKEEVELIGKSNLICWGKYLC